MANPESQLRPREAETMRDIYGPNWERDIGEPMVCSYLERNFPELFQRVIWASDLPKYVVNLEKNGIDAIGVLKSGGPQETPHFLALQISAASLHTEKGKQEWHSKLRAWKEKSPVFSLGALSSAIGGEEKNLMPVVFIKMDHADLDNAWERTSHGDWREEGAAQTAREAAKNLPRSIKFRSEILGTVLESLKGIAVNKPQFSRTLTPYRKAVQRSYSQLMNEKQKAVFKDR